MPTVLLDEFVQTTQASKDQTAAKLMASHKVAHPLDALLETLIDFTTEADLRARIQSLYGMLDQDENDGIGYLELQEGLRKLSIDAEPMHLSPDEYYALLRTPYGNFCNEEGEMSRKQFEGLIRHELTLYVQRQLALGSCHERTRSTAFSTTLASLRGMQTLVHVQQQQQTKHLTVTQRGEQSGRADMQRGPNDLSVDAGPFRSHASSASRDCPLPMMREHVDTVMLQEEKEANEDEDDEEEEVSGKMAMAHVKSLEAKMDAILNFFSIPPPTDLGTNEDGDGGAADAAPAETEGVGTLPRGGYALSCKGPATAADAWKNHKRMMIAAVKQRAASKEKKQSLRVKLLAGSLDCGSGAESPSVATPRSAQGPRARVRQPIVPSPRERQRRADDLVDMERQARRAAEAILAKRSGDGLSTPLGAGQGTSAAVNLDFSRRSSPSEAHHMEHTVSAALLVLSICGSKRPPNSFNIY